MVRIFWLYLNMHIGKEKPTVGGNLDIDETMYCTNSSEPGRLMITMQKGVIKPE